MIQITNISPQTWALSTSHKGAGRGEPVYMRLLPAKKGQNWLRILDKQLATYNDATKQMLAVDCELGLIQLHTMNGVHTGLDLTSKAVVVTAYGLDPATMTALDPILGACAQWKTAFNNHVLSTVYHSAAGTPLGAALPTSEATVITFVGAAKTAYNAHLADAGAHPTVDTTNLLAGGAPATYNDAVTQLMQLVALFQQHKVEAYMAAAAPLAPSAIITFT